MYRCWSLSWCVYMFVCLVVILLSKDLPVSLYITVYLSVCPTHSLNIWLTVCLTFGLSRCISVYLFHYLSVRMSVSCYMLLCLSVSLSTSFFKIVSHYITMFITYVCPSVCMSFSLCQWRSVYLSQCLAHNPPRLFHCINLYLSLYCLTLSQFHSLSAATSVSLYLAFKLILLFLSVRHPRPG